MGAQVTKDGTTTLAQINGREYAYTVRAGKSNSLSLRHRISTHCSREYPGTRVELLVVKSDGLPVALGLRRGDKYMDVAVEDVPAVMSALLRTEFAPEYKKIRRLESVG